MALGLSIIYGIVRVFNLAHGTLAVLGGYAAFSMINYAGVGVFLSIAITAALMFAFGLFLFYSAVARLTRKPNAQFAIIVFTLGLAILVESLIMEFFGARVKAVPRFFSGELEIGSIMIKWHEISLIVFVIVFFYGLNIFFKRTWIGRSMRSVAQDVDGAKVVGVDINRTLAFAFALATSVTAVSGILLATKYFLTPQQGWDYLFRGFVIVAFGGLGSAAGAVYAALILGMTESFISLYVGPIWVTPVWFVIFIGVLFFRPQGLFSAKSL